jgi:hypothetical protein
MTGFINIIFHNLSSQLLTITHNQSSAEPFFCDCRGVPHSALIWFYIIYVVLEWPMQNASIAQQWIYAIHIENASSSIVFTTHCIAMKVIWLLRVYLLLQECIYQVIAQQQVYMSLYHGCNQLSHSLYIIMQKYLFVRYILLESDFFWNEE